jgi:Radical SAM superfamily
MNLPAQRYHYPVQRENEVIKWFKKHLNTMFKMYWKTIFLSRKNKPFFWSRGSQTAIILTTRCPFHCEYCQMFIADGESPKYNECTLDEWKKFVENYPEWMELIMVSGGETTLYPEMPELVNWLVDRGHHILLFTNLWKPEVILRLKKSYKLLVWAAFQKTDSVDRFNEAYQMVKNHVRVEVAETLYAGEKRRLPYSVIKPVWDRDYLIHQLPTLSFPPDAPRTNRMTVNCFNVYRDGTSARDKIFL